MNERISSLISALGIKKSEFAKRLNISQAFVSQMCSGVAMPSDRTIAGICREFGVREEWLRTGEGPMRQSLSRQAEISKFVGEVMRDADQQDTQRILLALMDSTPDEIKSIVSFARRLAAQYESEQKDSP